MITQSHEEGLDWPAVHKARTHSAETQDAISTIPTVFIRWQVGTRFLNDYVVCDDVGRRNLTKAKIVLKKRQSVSSLSNSSGIVAYLFGPYSEGVPPQNKQLVRVFGIYFGGSLVQSRRITCHLRYRTQEAGPATARVRLCFSRHEEFSEQKLIEGPSPANERDDPGRINGCFSTNHSRGSMKTFCWDREDHD